jgi:hypothetical protein
MSKAQNGRRLTLSVNAVVYAKLVRLSLNEMRTLNSQINFLILTHPVMQGDIPPAPPGWGDATPGAIAERARTHGGRGPLPVDADALQAPPAPEESWEDGMLYP